MKFPYEPSCLSAGLLVGGLVRRRSIGWSVVIVSKKGEKLHFQAPIGALVYLLGDLYEAAELQRHGHLAARQFTHQLHEAGRLILYTLYVYIYIMTA